MAYQTILRKSLSSALWQDYRATETGMVLFYNSDPVSEMPIREVPDDADSDVIPEPHYETGTIGLYGCSRSKVRATIYKSRLRYLFFVTKYAGANEESRDKFLVTGYYRIVQSADVKKLHVIYCDENTCLDEDKCLAFRADDVHFVSLADAFEVTPAVLKLWSVTGKLTRQSRVVLDETLCAQLLKTLRDKPNQRQAYIAETRRLEPHGYSHDDDESAEGEESGK